MKAMLHKNTRIRIRSNTKNSCPFVLFSVFFAFLFAWPGVVSAAELKLSSPIQEIGINQQFQVDVVLNTENEDINALEGKIVFPTDLLDLKEIRDGNSIVNFWVERPKAETPKDANKNTNQHENISDVSCGGAQDSCGFVSFSGITPGGFNGGSGLIFSAIFGAKKEGSGEIEIREEKALLNDGRGTETKVTAKNLLVSIRADISVPSWVSPRDTDPPESFVPEIAADPVIFNGKRFLVFATQDKISGIAGYAIHENTRKKDVTRIDAKEWTEAKSPYLLKDQKLRSYIYVKAADKAGNERIVSLAPRYPMKWYERYEIWVIIIIFGVFLFVIRYLWKKLNTKNHK